MKWNVYVHNFNKNEIEVYNIFEHGSFIEELKKDFQECKNKDDFARILRSKLRYYYWSKAEWEIIISPWIGRKEPCDIKIDVYDQIMNNWEVFLDYVWRNMQDKRNI